MASSFNWKRIYSNDYLLDQPNLNVRQDRWLAFLSEYDFKIQHIKGKENKVIDALSRNAKLNFTVAISTYTIDLDRTKWKLPKVTSKSKREFNRKSKYRVQL